MDKWIVPLAVAAVGALATITAAYLAAAKDRRDVRGNILRDIEIAAKLREGSRERRALDRYIAEQTLRLGAEHQVARFNREELTHQVVPVVLITALLAGQGLGRGWQFVWLVFAAFLYVIVGTFGVARRRKRKVEERIAYLARQDTTE